MSEPEARTLPQYPGIVFYSDGTVRGRGGRLLTPTTWPGACRGTFSVNGKTYQQHVGICEAFNGPKPGPEYIVKHLNDHAWDNRPENLAWGTKADNQRERWEHRRRGCCRPGGEVYEEMSRMHRGM